MGFNMNAHTCDPASWVLGSSDMDWLDIAMGAGNGTVQGRCRLKMGANHSLFEATVAEKEDARLERLRP